MSGPPEHVKAKRPPMPGTTGSGTATIDVNEYGGEIDGKKQSMNRRLFMQLQVYRCPVELDPAATIQSLKKALKDGGVEAVLYADVNDPRGLGVLTFSESPEDFVLKGRPILNQPEFRVLELRPEFTMMGRTYGIGYERDLEHWILQRPRDNVQNPDWAWAIWYPLRRKGEFNRLAPREQGGILREHGTIGRAYGELGLASDVRLACHGIDQSDNEFVIGLVGPKLHPLSHVVQTMRKTRQTAEYMAHMGPFFVGHAVR